MPLYELKCRDCDHDWDVRQEWKVPLPACPECGSDNVRKVLHAAALVFKGSGWHVNDYGKNGAKTSTTTLPKSSESNGSNGESSAKPAETTAATSAGSPSSEKGSGDSTAKPDKVSAPAAT
jgi:putative FmdB family regulatory protein